MNDHPEHPQTHSPAPRLPVARTKIELPPEIRDEILRLHQFYGTRQIARRLTLSRKIVRRVLMEQGSLQAPARPPGSSKLEPFHQTIRNKSNSGLTTTRILREIRELGYTGGRSILAEYVQKLRASISPEPAKKAKRRFETPLAQ
jgi:transposase